jgi:hypothetical protein
MLERLHLISETFGAHKAAAAWLGYTERQYYNSRKRLENGKALNRRVESYITRMAEQLPHEASAEEKNVNQ